jgi:hypothetical protein
MENMRKATVHHKIGDGATVGDIGLHHFHLATQSGDIELAAAQGRNVAVESRHDGSGSVQSAARCPPTKPQAPVTRTFLPAKYRGFGLSWPRARGQASYRGFQRNGAGYS